MFAPWHSFHLPFLLVHLWIHIKPSKYCALSYITPLVVLHDAVMPVHANHKLHDWRPANKILHASLI